MQGYRRTASAASLRSSLGLSVIDFLFFIGVKTPAKTLTIMTVQAMGGQVSILHSPKSFSASQPSVALIRTSFAGGKVCRLAAAYVRCDRQSFASRRRGMSLM